MKYGENYFNWVVLHFCKSEDELNAKEKEAIKKLNTLFPNGYNLLSGGINFTHSKISETIPKFRDLVELTPKLRGSIHTVTYVATTMISAP